MGSYYDRVKLEKGDKMKNIFLTVMPSYFSLSVKTEWLTVMISACMCVDLSNQISYLDLSDRKLVWHKVASFRKI